MRVLAAFVVFGAALAVAVWLYTYEVSTVVEFIDAKGFRIRPSYRISEQPWWGTPAAVGSVLLGGALVMSLLPQPRRFVPSFTARLRGI